MPLQGTNIADKIVPFEAADTYPTHEDIYGLGGLVSVNSFSQIPGSQRRKIGQIYYFANEDRYYRLVSNAPSLTAGINVQKFAPYKFANSTLFNTIIPTDGNNTIVGVINSSFNSLGNTFRDSGILGGSQNILEIPNPNGNDGNPIVYNSFIISGSANRIQANSGLFGAHSVIVGGLNNFLNAQEGNTLVGGVQNTIIATNYSSLLGGRFNYIQNNEYNVLVGGRSNTIRSIGPGYSTIVNGLSNLSELSQYSFIGNGFFNRADGRFPTIVNGDSNRINESASGGDGALIYSELVNVNIDQNYVNNSKALVDSSYAVECLPGANIGGFTACGLVRFQSRDFSYTKALTSTTTFLTLSSPSPVNNGLFGNYVHSINDASGFNGYIIGAPGENKVYVYRVNNSNHTSALIQTINLTDVDPTAPSTSEFGYSLFYDNYLNTSFPNPLQYNLYKILSIGAPGSDTVYMFAITGINPRVFQYVPGTGLFSYLSRYQGQTGSRLGHSLIGSSVLRLSSNNVDTTINLPHLSASFILAGAPEYLNKLNIKTGAIYGLITTLSADTLNNTVVYSNLDKKFVNDFSTDNYEGWFLRAKEGFKVGEYLYHSGTFGTFLINEYSPNIRNLAEQTPFVLSSYYIRYTVQIPNASLKFHISRDENGKYGNNSVGTFLFTTDLQSNYWPTVSTIQLTAYNIGYGLGATTMLGGSANNNPFTQVLSGDWSSTPYGESSLLGGFNRERFDILGPNNITTGVYSIQEILTGSARSLYLGGYPQWGGQRASRVALSGRGFLGYDTTIDNRSVFKIINYNSGINNITRYGVFNFGSNQTDIQPGITRLYYLSGNQLAYSNNFLDLNGEFGYVYNTILNGNSNTIRGKGSTILNGNNNTVDVGNTRGLITGGIQNSITNNTGDGVNKVNSTIINGNNNIITGTNYGAVVGGNNNTINARADYSTVLGGFSNTVNASISASAIFGTNITADRSRTIFTNSLSLRDSVGSPFLSIRAAKPGYGLELINTAAFDPGQPFTSDGRGRFVHGLTLQAGIPNFTNQSDHFHLIWAAQSRKNWQMIQGGGPSDTSINSFSLYTIMNNVATTTFNENGLAFIDTSAVSDVPDSQPNRVVLLYTSNPGGIGLGTRISLNTFPGTAGIVANTYSGVITENPTLTTFNSVQYFSIPISLEGLAVNSIPPTWEPAGRGIFSTFTNVNGNRNVRLFYSSTFLTGTKISLRGCFNNVPNHILVTSLNHNAYAGMPIVLRLNESIFNLEARDYSGFVVRNVDTSSYVISLHNLLQTPVVVSNINNIFSSSTNWEILKGSVDAVHQGTPATQVFKFERYPTSDTNSTTTGGLRSISIGNSCEALGERTIIISDKSFAINNNNTIVGGTTNSIVRTATNSTIIGSSNCSVSSSNCFVLGSNVLLYSNLNNTYVLRNNFTPTEGNATYVTRLFVDTVSFTSRTNSNNVYIGLSAGYGEIYPSVFNTSNTHNIGIGTLASFTNRGGIDNVHIGREAGYFNTIGSGNIAVGLSAGSFIRNGNDNIFIGDSANTTTVNVSSINNSIAIGNFSRVSRSNELSIGSINFPLTGTYHGNLTVTDYLSSPNIRANNIVSDTSLFNNLTSTNAVTDTTYARIVDLDRVKFTGEAITDPVAAAATNIYIKVIVNNSIKYIRLFDVTEGYYLQEDGSGIYLTENNDKISRE